MGDIKIVRLQATWKKRRGDKCRFISKLFCISALQEWQERWKSVSVWQWRVAQLRPTGPIGGWLADWLIGWIQSAYQPREMYSVPSSIRCSPIKMMTNLVYQAVKRQQKKQRGLHWEMGTVSVFGPVTSRPDGGWFDSGPFMCSSPVHPCSLGFPSH